jgi:hypothetical protein
MRDERGGVMAGKTKPKTDVIARRQALVVAGMHRSGTSAMARLLSLSGATLPERVMDPGPDNPLGYWEPWEMVALSDEILGAVDSRWDNVFAVKDNDRAWAARAPYLDKAKNFLEHNFGDQDFLVMKDPRSSVLAGFWRHALSEIAVDPVYVIMVRHPLEVADSLLARNGFPREKSLMLWTSYMLAIERDTRDAPRVFVTYSDMLGDWRGVLDRVEQALGRPLPRRTPGAGVEIERFLSKSHRHHEADVTALDQSGYWPGAQTTYRWMLEAAQGGAPAIKTLAAVELELDGLERTVGPVLAEMRQELVQIPLARAEAAEARESEARTQFQLKDALETLTVQRDLINSLHAQADQARREAEGERAKVDILRSRASQMEYEIVAAKAHLAATQEQVAGLQAEVQSIFASTSWRLTRPLRAVIRRLRG